MVIAAIAPAARKKRYKNFIVEQSQLQQKNNLTIVTSTENLEELPESIDVFEQPSSATTSTTKNSTASNINSNRKNYQ